ncbi:hypothetical protein RF11_13082 [Thelohanellus kitauei]|uniref:ISXO2-like transposase domain-containing protein n=1 Tax=Thelohanellus kitauei TaxID=669202 RepID=A0A0C2MJQ9_THEKT|nr:hypothetical protein RF11_13082 [Thelohanellus kitauei]
MSIRIARAMKPHTIADELLLPTARQIVRVRIGEEYVNKLNGMYISIDTVHRRIADISADMLDQMIREMKSSTLPIFSIQLDELTDVEDDSQLLVYARYIHDKKFVCGNYRPWKGGLEDKAYLWKRRKAISLEGKITLEAVERNDISRATMIIVPNDKWETLLPIIQNHIQPGSIVVSDEWAIYYGLKETSYTHLTVPYEKFCQYTKQELTYSNNRKPLEMGEKWSENHLNCG